MTARRKVFYYSLCVFGVLLAWCIFRAWEGSHKDAPPGHHLSYVRPPNDQTDKLIVFVHGFGSDAKAAWTSDRTGAYWPQLILRDGELSSYAVLTTSYNSPPLRLGATIEQTAEALGTALKDEGIYTRFSQIIFIAHSMGGLIVRRMLVLLRNSGDDAALQRVAAVFFFATPTSGARLADLAGWISVNPQAHDLETSDVNTFLQSLDNDWEDLLRQRSLRTEGNPQIFCSYELQRTRVSLFTYVKIVPELYSKTTCDDVPAGFDRDHFTLVKPDDDHDDVYKWTRVRLLGVRGRIGQVMWNGGETLGTLVDRLQRAYRDNHTVPEIVRFSPGAERSISKLWIPPADYRRDSWGELFQTVAVDHRCLSVNIVEPGHIVELNQIGPVRACLTRTICKSDKCGQLQ
jgi:pimeloyl-ACP methyl ester carboxylesterase